MAQIIEKLTAKEEKILEKYKEKYTKITFDTTPTDKEKTENAIRNLYQLDGRITEGSELTFFWFEDPQQARFAAAQRRYSTTNPTVAQLRDMADSVNYGQFETFWVAFYMFVNEVVAKRKKSGITADPAHKFWDVVVQNAGTFYTLKKEVYISEKPIETHVNAENKLHNTSGPAILYKNGTGYYFENGEIKRSLAEAALDSLFGSEKI